MPKIIILLTLLTSFFFHLWQLDRFPPSPNWDEVSLGYNAYSILHTGRDEWGQWFPLIFRAYGDYKLPLYIYFSTPFIALFGLNLFSLRLTSVIAGTISGLIFYLICRQLFPKSRLIPISGLLIFAFSPWSTFLSRIALEANLFLCLFLTSLYFLIRHQLWQSSLVYGLCLFTYNSSRVLLLPYLIALLIQSHHLPGYLSRHWPKFIFLATCIIVFLFQSLAPSGQARYKWVSLLDSGAINRINELRQQFPRIIVNKYTYFTYLTTLNYLAHFDPRYLFWQGSSHYQFNIPHFPLISPLFFPFFLVGIFTLFRHRHHHPLAWWLIIFFTLVSPLPSAITRDAPQILRSLTFLPLVSLIILRGLELFSSRFALVYVTLATLSLFFLFWQKYPLYSSEYAPSWQYGYRQVSEFIRAQTSSIPILITKKYGEPHEFILFYLQYPPALYQQQKVWDYHADWYWVDSFDKYRFINDWDILTYPLPSPSLLITSPGNYPSGGRLLQTINYPDGTPVFDIVSYE